MVLSILDKPLSLLGKVNGLMKPEEDGGGCEECRGKEAGHGEVELGDQQGTEGENASLARYIFHPACTTSPLYAIHFRIHFDFRSSVYIHTYWNLQLQG